MLGPTQLFVGQQSGERLRIVAKQSSDPFVDTIKETVNGPF